MALRSAPAAGGREPLDAMLAELLATAPRVAPSFVARLAAVARGRSGRALRDWPSRRCAALMLEHLFWGCESAADEAVILSHCAPAGSREAIDAGELRRRIARNARVHAGLRGPETPAAARTDFLHLAAQESRLALLRWLWTPGEVIDRVLSAMRSSRAMIQPLGELPWIAAEAARALAALPEWERAVAAALASARCAFWVPLEPGAAGGDLVACPAGTVVLTVKPPGSDLEIEIKRAGRPHPRPLAVVWERDGVPVPPSHRLDAGSAWHMLRWEASSSARLSAVWRAIHGEEAPLSRVLAVKSVYALPDGGGEQPVLDYFIQEAAQPALARVVKKVRAEWGEEPPVPAGDVALAARYLLQSSPAQSVVLGTSAHRLDKLAAALGPAAERPADLPVEPEAARRALADLLDEVLGVFAPPAARFTSPAAWLDAAFAANRPWADACHREAARRLGALWGTFLALGICSSGESLVGRNVGIKAVFRAGEWRAELIAMDHDNLCIAWDHQELDPAALLVSNVKDEIALLGGPYKGAQVRGSLDLLGDLYRAGEAGRQAARAGFCAAARETFVRSVAALEPGGGAAGLFHPAYLADLALWRRAVRQHLAHGAVPARPEWGPTLRRYAPFLRRQAAIYLADSADGAGEE
ncbi:MAG TPA: hypothetical protein VLX28_15725 [Thermoanaerobaculia bacterium]|nr:hypothetical protein [Thermoanaerobaculia bacterium]